MTPDDRAPRCDVLDVLEAAIVTAQDVVVELTDGTAITARPLTIAARGGDDVVTFADGRAITVSQIIRARRP